jgi:hypothetical protein
MRKILLATTALVGVAFATVAPAHAAAPPASPLTVTVGGYVDAVAGFNHESTVLPTSITPTGGSAISTTGLRGNSHDFETEYKINIDVMGKAANGIQYGANISLWNGAEVTNLWTGTGNGVLVNSAYVWLSGAFGKAMFGDEHGASDLFVYAPTVGEGQIDGRYTDFVSPFLVARFQPSGIDNTEHSTKITYYTPKVGNEDHKVQLGVSYAPQMYDYGQNDVKSNVSFVTNGSQLSSFVNGPKSPYQDVIEGVAQYTGNFHPVSVTASAQIQTGSSQATVGTPALFAFAPAAVGVSPGELTQFQDFTAWGLGTQVGYNGFTAGGSYNDMGRYGTVHGQNRPQTSFTLGGKYEMDKVAVGASWLTGRGYSNLLAGHNSAASALVTDTNYVDQFNAYSIGATYNWFPGLTTAVDGTMFQQNVRDQFGNNDGYVLMVSQKLTF